MSDRASIETRVLSFIADYAEWNRTRDDRSQGWDGDLPSPCEIDPADFAALGERSAREGASEAEREAALEKLHRLAAKHCTDRKILADDAMVLSSQSKHDPDVETITDVTVEGGRATVKTAVPGSYISNFRYTLERVRATWLIARIEEFQGEDRRPEEFAWGDATYHSTFSLYDDAGLDLTAPFRAGAEAINHETGGSGPLVVVAAGEVELPSGLLIAADPAYADEARPLEVRASRTRLPVEIALADGSAAFVRVWLEPGAEIAAHVPARLVAQAGDEEPVAPYQVGTRCGGFALADAGAWLGMSSHEGQEFCRGMTETLFAPPRPALARAPLPAAGGVSALLVARGGGDFSSPCYWALDAAGRPVALVIDLMLCGEYADEEYVMPFSEHLLGRPGPIPQLTEFGGSMRLVRESAEQLQAESDGSFDTVELIDASDGVVATTASGGLTVHGRDHFQFLACPDPLPPHLRLRVRWRRWRHAFARES